jgi:hypothetical protein
MVVERPDQDDQTQECATCGHPGRFHNATSATDGHEPENRPCTNPEDGEPCPCAGYQPVA